MRTAGATSAPRLLDRIAHKASLGQWSGRDVVRYRRMATAEGGAPDDDKLKTLRHSYYEAVFAHNLDTIEKNAQTGRWQTTEIARYLEAARQLGHRPDRSRLERAWQLFYDHSAERPREAVNFDQLVDAADSDAVATSDMLAKAAGHILHKIKTYAGGGQWSEQRVDAYRKAAARAGIAVDEAALTRALANAANRPARLLRKIEALADTGSWDGDKVKEYRALTARAGVPVDTAALEQAHKRCHTAAPLLRLCSRAKEGLWRRKDEELYRDACTQVGLDPKAGLTQARGVYLNAVLQELEARADEGEWSEWSLDTYRRVVEEDGLTPDDERVQAAKQRCCDFWRRKIDGAAGEGEWPKEDVASYERIAQKLGIDITVPREELARRYCDLWLDQAETAARAKDSVSPHIAAYRVHIEELGYAPDAERIAEIQQQKCERLLAAAEECAGSAKLDGATTRAQATRARATREQATRPKPSLLHYVELYRDAVEAWGFTADEQRIAAIVDTHVRRALELAREAATSDKDPGLAIDDYRTACESLERPVDESAVGEVIRSYCDEPLVHARSAAENGESVEALVEEHERRSSNNNLQVDQARLGSLRQSCRKSLQTFLRDSIGRGEWPADNLDTFVELSQALDVDPEPALKKYRSELATAVLNLVGAAAAQGQWILPDYKDALTKAGVTIEDDQLSAHKRTYLDALLDELDQLAAGGTAEAIVKQLASCRAWAKKLDIPVDEARLHGATETLCERLLADAEAVASHHVPRAEVDEALGQAIDVYSTACEVYEVAPSDARLAALQRERCRAALDMVFETAERAVWADSYVSHYRKVCKRYDLPADERGLKEARRAYAESCIDLVEASTGIGDWLAAIVEQYRAVCKELGLSPDEARLEAAKARYGEHRLQSIERDAQGGSWNDDVVQKFLDEAAQLGFTVDTMRLSDAWEKYLRAGGDADRETAPSKAKTPTSPAQKQLAEVLDKLEAAAQEGEWPGGLFREYLDTANKLGLRPDRERTLSAWETYVRNAGGVTAPDQAVLTMVEEKKSALVDKLLDFKKPATQADASLLRRLLLALDHKMLSDLAGAGYSLTVTRHRIGNANADLRNEVINDGQGNSVHSDFAEGVHQTSRGMPPHIIVRTYWDNGALQLDASTLLHELGHAYDLVINRSKDGPDNVKKDLAEAFQSEHKHFADSYFHTQEEFVAEVTAYYLLDPERCRREFPQACAALRQRFANRQPDHGSIARLQHDLLGRAVVNVNDDPTGHIAYLEGLNVVREREGLPRQPYMILLKGTREHGSEALASDLASALRLARSPDQPRFRRKEAMEHVSAATFNNPSELRKILDKQLTADRGAMLYVDDVANIQPSSPGFALLASYYDRLGGIVPLVFAGEPSAIDKLANVLPAVPKYTYELEPLEPEQGAELLERMAKNEGYSLEPSAREAVIERGSGGGSADVQRLWQQVKKAQLDRVGRSKSGVPDIETMNHILKVDVESAALPPRRDPLAEADRMVGQAKVKSVLRTLLNQAEQAKRLEQLGKPFKRPRLNLLFSGNPGTGKTTWANLLVEALHSVGYLKRKTVAIKTVQDLLGGSPEENIKRLFEANKGGAIFIDEFHQLKDTKEGQRAFRAMIPYLADPAYQDTVFIGAGYEEELQDLLRDIDPGAERRFRTVPFVDFTQEEQRAILHKMAGDQDIELDVATEAAALSRIAREARKMKHFGNAGTIENVIDAALNARAERLGGEDASQLDAQAFVLRPEDFRDAPPVTLQEVWKEINALDGLAEVKSRLKRIEALATFARDNRRNPLDFFEPYFIFQGPPGTGKTTVARLIGKFFAALDLIPAADVKEYSGGDLQAEYVGQTKNTVRKMFERAWGRVLFLDEAGAIAVAGGSYKEEAAKEMLKQLEDYRGRFVMIVADYENNINDFLALDAGLPRRFGTPINFEAMSSQTAADSLASRLGGEGFDATNVGQLIADRMSVLVDIPGWASGGDVRKLVNLIVQHQALQIAEAAAAGESHPGEVLLAEAVEGAFSELIDTKRARADAMAEKAAQKPEAGVLYATQAQAAVQAPELEQEVTLDSKDEKVLAAIATVDNEFKKYFDAKGPDAQKAAEANPDSAYIRRIAEELGVSTQEATEALTKTKVKVKRLVTVKKLEQKFEYHCPYCGGIESPSCAYVRMPLDWKIQHSTKKPWTVEHTETKVVEEEVEA